MATDCEHTPGESNELFRGVFDYTCVAMVVTDIDNRFVRTNTAFARLFGYTSGEMIGMTMADVTHPDDIAESYALRASLLAGERYFFQREKRYVHRNGETFWGLTNVSLVRDPDGKPIRYVGQVQDITERKRAEAALVESEARYRTVVEGSIQGIVIHQDGLIRYTNAACAAIYGYSSADELIGQNWQVLIGADDWPPILARAETVLRGGTVPPHPGWQAVRRDGKKIWHESIVSRIMWEGRPAALAFILEITERKRLEEQFRQSQKMEAVGRLAGGVAHDFNNLLTIIIGNSDLLLQDIKPGDHSHELLGEIRKAGERSAGLTRQLLAFSRQQVLSPRVLDLNAVVTDAEKMLNRIIGEDVHLSTALMPGLRAVRADLGQIEQVLLNLAINARDAMPQGGRLTIETRNVELDSGMIKGSHVLLAISDTGCGMTEEVKTRIFEPFFTTKDAGKGTGLGLATVFGIVKQSGGHIEVYSEVGLGTTFKVYLPRVESMPGGPKSTIGIRTPPRGTETVLLVEDEDGVRLLTRNVLRECGYTVIEAANGKEAMREAEGYPDSLQLLVTDVVMPGIGGRILAEQLSATRPHLKVLFLSGYTDDAVVRHGILHDQVHFLQKPFTPVSLALKVREVLDGAG